MNAAVRSALSEAMALAFPVACCACGGEGADLCPACAAQIVPRPRVRRLPGGLAVWSALEYSGAVVPAVRALKEQGRTGLARALAPALRAAVLSATASDDTVLLAPVPSSRAAMRRRGYRVVELLLRRAALRPVRLLAVARRMDDQRGLDRQERLHNTKAGMRALESVEGRVLIVDDVVTTGATLTEAARALEAAGARVVAAATLASTPLKSHGQETRT